MTLEEWLAFAALALATYFTILHLSLNAVSRSALLRRLVAREKDEQGKRLLASRRACDLVITLLRTTVVLAFFSLVIVDAGIFAEDGSVAVGRLVTACVIGVGALWLANGVLAASIARHASTGVIATALPLLRLLAALGRPLERILRLVDEIVRRLSGANLNQDDHVEAELLRSIEDSQLEGGIDEEAAELLENVVEFRSTDVGEVMTPRTDIEGIELTDDLAAIRKFIIEAGHSRIPVYEENLDNLLGILYVKDLIPYLGEDASDFTLRPLLREPIRVPETKPVSELLSDFQRAETHMAVVIDEYGGTSGLVTIEDVLEELVGEIKDEHDPEGEEEPTLTPVDDTHAEVDGRFHIDDLNEITGLELPRTTSSTPSPASSSRRWDASPTRASRSRRTTPGSRRWRRPRRR